MAKLRQGEGNSCCLPSARNGPPAPVGWLWGMQKVVADGILELFSASQALSGLMKDKSLFC